jgi:Icc-related predicted phosphoesterase
MHIVVCGDLTRKTALRHAEHPSAQDLRQGRQEENRVAALILSRLSCKWSWGFDHEFIETLKEFVAVHGKKFR